MHKEKGPPSPLFCECTNRALISVGDLLQVSSTRSRFIDQDVLPTQCSCSPVAGTLCRSLHRTQARRTHGHDAWPPMTFRRALVRPHELCIGVISFFPSNIISHTTRSLRSMCWPSFSPSRVDAMPALTLKHSDGPTACVDTTELIRRPKAAMVYVFLCRIGRCWHTLRLLASTWNLRKSAKVGLCPSFSNGWLYRGPSGQGTPL